MVHNWLHFWKGITLQKLLVRLSAKNCLSWSWLHNIVLIYFCFSEKIFTVDEILMALVVVDMQCFPHRWAGVYPKPMFQWGPVHLLRTVCVLFLTYLSRDRIARQSWQTATSQIVWSLLPEKEQKFLFGLQTRIRQPILSKWAVLCDTQNCLKIAISKEYERGLNVGTQNQTVEQQKWGLTYKNKTIKKFWKIKLAN